MPLRFVEETPAGKPQAAKGGGGLRFVEEPTRPARRQAGGDSTASVRMIEKRKALAERGLDAPGEREKGRLAKWSDDFTASLPLPILDEINAGVRAGGNELWNQTYRRARGEAPVDSEAIYLGQMDADREIMQARRKRSPVTTAVAPLFGGGGAAKGAAGLLQGAPRAVQYLGRVGQAVGAGGLLGGAYGAAEAAPGQRAEGGTTGATVGALTGGLLEGVGVPLATKAVKSFAPAASALARKVTGRTGATRGERELARGLAADLATRGGLRSGADVAGRSTRELAGEEAMAAELIGREAENKLATLARRGGQTGETVSAKVAAREQARPQRIREVTQERLGVDPASAEGDLTEMVLAGEARAKPLFDEALGRGVAGNPQGVWNDELGGLATDPMVADAMKSAGLSAQRRGDAPEGLTYGPVDVPGDTDLTPYVEAGALRGDRGVTGGTPLLQFIGRSGGLKGPEVGDLLGLGADQWHIGKPFMNRLIGPRADKAHDIERMAEMAFDAGYFPERVGIGPPSPREFLDTLADEMAAGSAASPTARGNRFARNGESIQRREGSARPPEEAEYYGETLADDLPNPDDYGADVHAPPEREPALMEAPTAQAWDLTRRRLNELVDWRPSGPLDRVQATDAKVMAQRLTRALAGDESGQGAAIPGLRAALDAGGEPIRMREAYREFAGKVFGNAATFRKAFDRLKPGDQAGVRAAVANDIQKLFGSGKLKGGKFLTPDMRLNLTKVFGAEAAEGFAQNMQAQARLAASGNRIQPNSGSQTQRLTAADQELAGVSVQDVARIVSKAKLSPGAAVADVLTTFGDRALSMARSHELPVTVRDELGRILQMDAQQFGRFLDRYAAKGEARRAAQAAWARGRAIMAGGAGGLGARAGQEPEVEAYLEDDPSVYGASRR